MLLRSGIRNLESEEFSSLHFRKEAEAVAPGPGPYFLFPGVSGPWFFFYKRALLTPFFKLPGRFFRRLARLRICGELPFRPSFISAIPPTTSPAGQWRTFFFPRFVRAQWRINTIKRHRRWPARARAAPASENWVSPISSPARGPVSYFAKFLTRFWNFLCADRLQPAEAMLPRWSSRAWKLHPSAQPP